MLPQTSYQQFKSFLRRTKHKNTLVNTVKKCSDEFLPRLTCFVCFELSKQYKTNSYLMILQNLYNTTDWYSTFTIYATNTVVSNDLLSGRVCLHLNPEENLTEGFKIFYALGKLVSISILVSIYLNRFNNTGQKSKLFRLF